MEVDQAAAPPENDGLPPGATLIWDSRAAPATATAPPTFQTTNEKDAQGNAVVVPALRSPMVQGGRGTQLDLDKSNRGWDAANTPLVDTGYPALDRFTSPIGMVAMAGGGAAVLRAGLSGGFAGAGWEALSQAAPQIRYDVYTAVLEKLHIPGARAIALVLSSYPKPSGTAAEPTPRPTAPPPVRWPQEPAAAGPVAPPPIVYRQPAAPTPTVAAPPVRWPQEPAATPTPTVAAPPVRWPQTPAAAPPVAAPPIRYPAEAAPAPTVQPPPIVYRNTVVEPAPRVVAAPPIRWPEGTEPPSNTVGAFAPGGAPPAATPAAATTPATGSATVGDIRAATKVLVDGGVARSDAAKLVARWIASGHDLIRAATAYLKD